MAGTKRVLDIAEVSARAGYVAQAVSLHRKIPTKVPLHPKGKKAFARFE